MKSKRRELLVVSALVVTAAAGGLFESKANDQKPAKPKLAVVVVFDQMRGDYLEKWQELFEDGGFKRLQTEGAWFTNCHYPYAETLTSVGHTSLMTGTSPYKHGIIANDWYDRASGAVVASVHSDRYQPLPPVKPDKDDEDKDGKNKDDKDQEPKDKKEKRKPYGAAPLRRREETVGDVLHRATKGKSKIGSLSIKDTAAVLLAALRAQFVYWFSSTGQFVTSTYYADARHAWVNDFNNSKLADRWFGKDWTVCRPNLDYVKYSGPDDVPGEALGYKQGRTFPHPMTGGADKIGKKYYGAMTNSPRGNELLLALAKTAIEAEKMGQGTDTDLLTISFSSNDFIGHTWGPDSQEVLDVTLSSDRIMKELLDFLDAKVGKGQYLVLLSADHGVCPVPEITKAQGKDAGRVSADELRLGGAAHLQATFAKDGPKLPWFDKLAGTWFYFNKGVARELGLSSRAVEEALAGWLVEQPGVQAAYTRTQLLQAKTKLYDPLAEAVRLSFFPDNCGEVKFLLKPHYQFSINPKKGPAYATTHGTPYPYDTHVPLLVYGPGVRPGKHAERITPQALAAILARGLDLPPPSAAEAPVPKGVFE